jgi:hypothetical protein
MYAMYWEVRERFSGSEPTYATFKDWLRGRADVVGKPSGMQFFRDICRICGHDPDEQIAMHNNDPMKLSIEHMNSRNEMPDGFDRKISNFAVMERAFQPAAEFKTSCGVGHIGFYGHDDTKAMCDWRNWQTNGRHDVPSLLFWDSTYNTRGWFDRPVYASSGVVANGVPRQLTMGAFLGTRSGVKRARVEDVTEETTFQSEEGVDPVATQVPEKTGVQGDVDACLELTMRANTSVYSISDEDLWQMVCGAFKKAKQRESVLVPGSTRSEALPGRGRALDAPSTSLPVSRLGCRPPPHISNTPQSYIETPEGYMHKRVRPVEDCVKCEVARGPDASVREDFAREGGLGRSRRISKRRACALAQHAMPTRSLVEMLECYERKYGVVVAHKKRRAMDFMMSEYGVAPVGKAPRYAVTLYEVVDGEYKVSGKTYDNYMGFCINIC